MEVTRDRKKIKLNLGVTCSKYMLFALNFVYLVSIYITETIALGGSNELIVKCYEGRIRKLRFDIHQ